MKNCQNHQIDHQTPSVGLKNILPLPIKTGSNQSQLIGTMVKASHPEDFHVPSNAIQILNIKHQFNN